MPNDGEPAVLYEDFVLLEFLQGEWASDVDLDGFSFVMLVHDDMLAISMAYPKREDASLSNWRNGEYWGVEPWDWYACSVDGNGITADSGDGFEQYWVYALDTDTIRLSFAEVNGGDWADADYLQVKRVRDKSQFDLAAYLDGRWISSMPFDKETETYIGLSFPGDGTCMLSTVQNISGDADVSKRRMDGWDFEVYRTYDFASTRDGFTVTHEGVTETYKVTITGFASARFVHVGSDEDILYYRTLD